jgi:ATP-dependent RNA helicase DDX20
MEEPKTNGNAFHHKENEVKQRTADIQVSEDFTFSKFLLSDKLHQSLKKLNFIQPSPIQLKVIPLAKSGMDMIVQAKSGTGKTLAFSICLLENYDMDLKFPQALVLVPTREIAVQIVGVLNELGGNVKHFRAFEFIGGTEVSNDRKKIQAAKVVVGTPGRILHLIQNEIFNINNLKALVLDEADKLLESGQMAKDVTALLKLMPKKIQIIATTATVTSHLEKIMKKVMKNPIGITPKHEIPVLLGIKQFVKVLPREADNILLMNSKIAELQKIFTRITFKQCLLFTDSQSKTESYGNYLNKQGWKNEVINGAQDQSQRLKVLEKLIKFKCRILITTDLLARGIDIENINLIINLDLPYDCFTYLHRIGRAGRFGSHGIAITFVNGEEELDKFQTLLGDVGGSSLKALKYPDESTSYDFWNFEQNDANLLDTVSSVSRNGFEDEILVDELAKENVELLEITRRLIDDKSKVMKKFDLNELLNDYEKTFEKPTTNGTSQSMEIDERVDGEIQKKAENPMKSLENLVADAIKDLNLYDDDIVEDNSTKNASVIEQTEAADVRKVIFKRTTAEEENSSLTSSSESEEDELEEVDWEGEEEDVDEGDTQEMPQEEQDRNYYENPSANATYASYHNYVAEGYSQWENIYHFQLAGIQNYIQSSKR